MMPRYQQQQPISSPTDKREGLAGAISLWAFNFRLWLLDPFAECRKATECRNAQDDEDSDMSWVEFKFRALPANRGTMWIPRMDLPPPHLSEEFTFKCPSKFSPPAATTPTFTSSPSSHCGEDGDSDHDGDDSNDSDINIEGDSDATEQPPSIGSGGGDRDFSPKNDTGEEKEMPRLVIPVPAGVTSTCTPTSTSASASISFPMITPPPASNPPSKTSLSPGDLFGCKLWWL